MSAVDYDIAIAGGGLVGAALGALLLRQGRVDPRRVLLLERDWPAVPASGSGLDLRVSAFSRSSRQVLEACDAWRRLDATRVSPYQRMRVWHEGLSPQSADALRFDAAEIAAPDLGAIIENRAVQAALLAAYVDGGGAVRRERLTGLVQQAAAVQLQTDSGSCSASLLVGADGATSQVRELAGIETLHRPYGERAIVAMIRCQQAHQATAWQNFLPTGPLALLPLADGHCSIVWSAVDAESERLMALDAATFERELTRASGGALGELALASERLVFPLRRIAAERYVAGRCALIGDAAHVIHPLAGQGVNQGLLDALALCRLIAARPPREDVAAPRLLRAYERERRSGNALMGALVDQLDSAFKGAPGITGRLAREALGVVARSGPLRQFFARQANGS
jgi:2-octaprenylphenol hydroxylase